MNKELDRIVKFLENKEVYIYGCGLLGKMLVSWLEDKKNIRSRAIVVSTGHREDTEYITLNKTCFPILEFDDVKYQNKLEVIYINTVIAGNELIEKMLEKEDVAVEKRMKGFFPYILNEYAEEYYMRCHLDFSKKVLDFNGIKVFNPCKINKKFKGLVFGTMGDEIIPPQYNDYSLTVDGAYEFSNVCLVGGEHVIDAGANIGLFSCYAASKGCRVYACEPDRQALQILKEQQKLYPENLHIIEKGLSDKEENVTFYESDDCALSSIDMPRGKVNETVIEVTTIDALVENGIIEKVDYIKADIEGAERDMLRGAVNTLRRFAPKLSICTYHYPEDKELLTSIIKEANPNYVVEYRWRKLYAYVE